jgi:prepilin-type N-terminal cleavage/methylation domain-containing protein
MSEVDERGFTLLEIVCVLGIIALLTACLERAFGIDL